MTRPQIGNQQTVNDTTPQATTHPDLHNDTAVFVNGAINSIPWHFVDNNQRDTQWPNPPAGALCVTTDRGIMWQMAAGSWKAVHDLSGPGAVNLRLGGTTVRAANLWADATVLDGGTSGSGFVIGNRVQTKAGNSMGDLGYRSEYNATATNPVKRYVYTEKGVFKAGGTFTTSSRRFKHDIADAPDDLADKALALQPRQFKWNFTEGHEQTDSYGLIAEEVEGVDKLFATFEADTREMVQPDLLADVAEWDAYNAQVAAAPPIVEGLNDRAILASLVALCQRQQAEIDALKAAI
jgi:hypothetical protein